MRGYVVKKGKNYYAVLYEGIDPGTGKERRRWVAAGPRRGDAEALVGEMAQRQRQGDNVRSDRIDVETYLTKRWLPIQQSRLRPNTYLSYRRTVELHVIPRIGKLRLDKLQPEDLDLLYAGLLRDGRQNGKGGGLSATSVRYVHRVISKALSDAHRKGIIGRNIADRADPPKAQANRANTTIHVWDADTLQRFLSLTADHPHHDLWAVASGTGMRRGELLGLRWTDIDLDRATISVRRAIVSVAYEIQLSDVKTSTGRRTIDIGVPLVAVLRRRLDDAQQTSATAGSVLDPQGLVFARADGEPIHPERVSRTFDQQVAKHGLPRIRFHDVRHTHATLLLQAGVPAKVVSERLGHATPGFTLNVYQHVLPGMQAAAAGVFDALLDAAKVRTDPAIGSRDDSEERGSERPVPARGGPSSAASTDPVENPVEDRRSRGAKEAASGLGDRL